MTGLRLTRPLKLTDVHFDHDSQPEPAVRLFRLKSGAEVKQTATYAELALEIRDMYPTLRKYHRNVSTSTTEEGREAALRNCTEILAYLGDMRRVKLPACGYPAPNENNLDSMDLVSCGKAAQGLVLHGDITHMTWCILRRWILAPPLPAQAMSLLRRIQVAYLDNARFAIQHFDPLRDVISARLSPYVTTTIIINLYNAATTLALPVLRYARGMGQKIFDVRDVTSTSIWPNGPSGRSVRETANTAPLKSESIALSTMSFSELEVRQYAADVLRVLEMLSFLDACRLGESAKSALATLIGKYSIKDISIGLSDSGNQSRPEGDAHPQSGTATGYWTPPWEVTPQNIALLGSSEPSEDVLDQSAITANPFSGPTAASVPSSGEATASFSTDDDVLTQFLQLDPEIWQSLMQPAYDQSPQ